MSSKTITGECLNCESSYEISYVTEMVAHDVPDICPFCGENIEDIIEEEYIDEDELSEDDEEWE